MPHSRCVCHSAYNTSPNSFCGFLVMIKLFILQQEIAECVSELETLGFREEVLRKEKELLSQFASHISKTHSVKVGCLGGAD